MPLTTGIDQLLQGKHLLIFDFDGTIADTSPLHAAAFAQVLSSLGVGVDYPKIAGMKTLDAMCKCLKDAGLTMHDDKLNALVQAKQQAVRAMMATDLTALPGVDAFLHWARPRFRLSMATSGSRGTVELALSKLGYMGWFDPLVCADEISRAKPDPEGFVTVLQLTGTSADEAIVFEDSAAGLDAAHAAGIDCVPIYHDSWFRLMKGVA